MIERLKELIGKNVFIETSSGRYFNGIVNAVEDNLISMIDKFDEPVFISISEIKFVQVKKE